MTAHSHRTGGAMPDRQSHSLVSFDFHGDELAIIRTEDGEHWVVLARLCEPFGLRVDGQAEKLRARPWARTQKIWVRDSRGQEQEAVCLNIRSVAGWLFTVHAPKVAEVLREKLTRYQKECADALADRFLGARAPALPEPKGGLLEQAVAGAVEPLQAELKACRNRLSVLEARPSRQLRLLSMGKADGPTEEDLRALALRLAGDPQRTFTSREHLATLLRVPLSLGRVIVAEMLSTGDLVKENGRIIARRGGSPYGSGGVCGERAADRPN
jgi:hypothetical protein